MGLSVLCKVETGTLRDMLTQEENVFNGACCKRPLGALANVKWPAHEGESLRA